MLISEIYEWHYFMSWDNPLPADSSKLLQALEQLGRVNQLDTKTSVVLSPKSTTTEQDVQTAIQSNLNQTTGKAFYVNLKTVKGWQYGPSTNGRWMPAP